MTNLLALGFLALSYIIGSIPFGLLIVRLRTGKDIRQVESGRTGGTNAMRAAGFGAGLATAVLDLLKAAVTVWLARAVFEPGTATSIWVQTLAPICAVLGHNYSIFLAERTPEGRLRLRGGAGGAPATGGAFGLWPYSILIILPIGILILYWIGYASVATMSVAFVATLIFAYRAWIGASPWEYVVYGLATSVILIVALRPNIRRLLNGTERLVGYRAKRMRMKNSEN